METPATVRAVIDLWPARKDLAADLSLAVERVHKWAQANAIPAKYHLAVIRAAEARGYAVSADLLANLHAIACVERAA